jgi:hypothetical protein
MLGKLNREFHGALVIVDQALEFAGFLTQFEQPLIDQIDLIAVLLGTLLKFHVQGIVEPPIKPVTELKLVVNPQHILDVPKAMGGEECTLHWTSEVSPVMITGLAAPDYIYITMPIRMD